MKFSVFAISVSLLLLSSVNTAALADGMPFKPEPILTPLDKALDEIQSAPAAVKPANAEIEKPVEVSKPVEELPVPKADVPPVPESRIVEVQPDTSFFGLSVGMYDPFTHNEKAAAFNLEWQPGVRIAGFLQPLFGAMVTTQGSMLGYGGIGIPFNVSEHVMMMPSVAVGAYKEGDGFDLGQTLAFRVGTELAYQFDDKSRIGLNLHVLTNGQSFSREDRTEIIGLTYTTPLNMISKPRSETVQSSDQQASPPQ